MSYEQIQNQIKELHRELWRAKELLWPNQSVLPLQMLEPWAVAEILGVEYMELPNLGHQLFSFKGKMFKVAGTLDRQANKIAVSTEFSPTTIRFTAAHEIAHWILHQDEIMHRDRPIGGLTLEPRPMIEKEADYGAACYLMPARLLGDMFKGLFQTKIPLVINETVAFHLYPQDPQSLTLADENSLDRELAIARCRSFNGRHFYSLSEQFRVSDLAMAIRIKELKLIQWP